MLEEDTKKIMDFALSKIEKGGIIMCVPTVFIREDGKGFIVKKDGEEFNIYQTSGGTFEAFLNAQFDRPIIYQFQFVPFFGSGRTIMEAVDNALQKVRAAENKGGGSK